MVKKGNKMSKREEKIKKAYNLAYKYEAEKGSCPQCVYSAILEALDIGNKSTVKDLDALAGGTALSAEGTCGALVGGLCAISSIVGRTYEDFSKGERKRRVFRYSKKLYDKFLNEYSSILCKNVHKKLFGKSFNLMDKDEYAEFEKMGAHVDKCPKVSGKTAAWAAEIILDDILK
jgi:C_GCAxxG_C_C family probable redox protein